MTAAGDITGRGLLRTDIAMIIVHSIKSLQETFDARASEWMLTGMTISLGLLFFFNTTFFYGEFLEGLRNVMNSQRLWAWLLTTVGLARLSVLLVNGAYWRTPHFRAATAFLCSGVWFIFCLGFIRNGSLLIAIMPWVFVLDAYNVKRASHEAGKSEFIQRYVKKQDNGNAGLTKGTHL